MRKRMQGGQRLAQGSVPQQKVRKKSEKEGQREKQRKVQKRKAAVWKETSNMPHCPQPKVLPGPATHPGLPGYPRSSLKSL
jgi:hypothetical protein